MGEVQVLITVVIPVGPSESNKQWLGECLESVFAQTHRPEQILLIDDQAHLDVNDGYIHINGASYQVDVWKTPWRSGVAHAFNFGVALARNELIVMLGSDDWLEPDAISRLLDTYKKSEHKDAWYSFTIRYSDNDELQDEHCNCAAVTKGLWKLTGGFPPESEIGACDSIFISMMMVHHSDRLIKVAEGKPLYNYRRHQQSDTGTRSSGYQGPIFVVRDLFTRNWEKPSWT